MKKLFGTLAAVLAITAMLTVFASAAPGERLAAFEDIASMTTYTFKDVSTRDWCYTGIKAAYDKGILLGYDDGTFLPESYVNWAHAITIAARLHAVYHGNSLRTTADDGEFWYQPYYDYCESYDLLPPTTPKGVYLSGVVIPRYALAYIFSRAIDAEDMPVISDRPIADLNSIPAEYREAVQTMYASGVMTGYEDNRFDGNASTKRSHVAVVVARLLLPSNRFGHDSRANADMADFESNLENDSIVVQYGGYYYCLYKYYETTTDERFALYRTDGNDNAVQLYSCKDNEYLSDLSLYNGCIYFSKNNAGSASGAMMKYDPKTGKVSTIYIGYNIESYCFYDGELYALVMTKYATSVDGYEYTFGKIEGNNFEAILGPYGYRQVTDFVPYGWNGSIYFKLVSETTGTNLFAFDLTERKLTKICNIDIDESVFDDHVMYFIAYDKDGKYDLNLYALSIEMPSIIKTVGTYPLSTNANYRTLYKHGDLFYCLSSNNHNVFSMDEAGKTKLAIMCGGVYNSMCFTDSKVFIIPTNIVTCNVNEIKVFDGKSLSSEAVYGDWMGDSCYYEGAHFVPDAGEPVFTTADSVSTVTRVHISVPKAFSRGDDFIVQTKYTNTTDDVLRMRMYAIRLYYNDELVGYDINRMVSMDMVKGNVHTYTFVIGDVPKLKNVDLNNGKFEIEIVPTFDVVQKQTGK